MSRMTRVLVLLAAFGLWGGVNAAQPLKQQASESNAVTVKAVPLNVRGPVWEFELVFDTHTQALNDDLLNSAVLVAGNGSLIKPTAWDGDPPSGHHRKGTLRFSALNPLPNVLELRISRPNEPTARTFRWAMPGS